jgi:hypothetical protein
MLRIDGDYGSAICGFVEHEAVAIASEIVLGLAENPAMFRNFTRSDLDWALHCTGFALRVNDGQDNPSVFLLALDLYYMWLRSNIFQFQKDVYEQYTRVFLVQLSQVSLNPSFPPQVETFVRIMRDVFLGEDIQKQISQQTWSLFLSVLMSSVVGLSNLGSEGVLSFCKLTMDCIFSGAYTTSSFLHMFDPEISLCLSSVPQFRVVWAEKFKNIHQNVLNMKFSGRSKQEIDAESLCDFIVERIDEIFSDDDKQAAFKLAIDDWLGIIDKTEADFCIRDKWSVEHIKGFYLKWWISDAKWTAVEFTGMNRGVWHPLFQIIMSGEDDAFLIQKAVELITKTVKTPVGAETDIYWYLPIYAYDFLHMRTSLLIEILPELMDLFGRWGKSGTTTEILQSVMLLMLTLIRCVDSTMRKRMISLMPYESDDFGVMFASILGLLFSDESDMFWNQLDRVLTREKFRKMAGRIKILGGLAPLLFGHPNPRLMSGFWEPCEDSVSSQQYLIAVLAISEGTDYFYKNPIDGAKILCAVVNAGNSSDLSIYQDFVKLSILCGGGLKAVPSELLEKRSDVNFATRNFFVSIVDTGFLVIRHPLGVTAYEIRKQTGPPSACRTFSSTMFGGHIDSIREDECYHSILKGQEELSKEIEELNSSFAFWKSTAPYSAPEVTETFADAQSLLCDLGFLSAESAPRVRGIPKTLRDAALDIDSIVACPILTTTVLQFVDKSGKFYSKRTEELVKLIGNLAGSDSLFCRFAFESAFNSEKTAEIMLKDAIKNGFFILLNETGRDINGSWPGFDGFETVLCISPVTDQFYTLLVLMRYSAGFHGMNCRSFHVDLHCSDLASFVGLIIFIYFACPGKYVGEGVRGPNRLINGVCDRLAHIAQIYDRAEGGIGGMLLACLAGFSGAGN